MFYGFFTNRWILGCIGFLVIFAGLCYLYYHHTTAPYREQVAEHNEMLRQSESQRTAPTAKPTDQAADAPVDSDTLTAEKPITQTKTDIDDIDAAEAAQDKQIAPSVAEVVEVAVRVSPIGFGAYPQIPAVYRDLDGVVDIWAVYEKMAETDPETARMNELGERVLIKLWEEGLQPTGGTHKNGRFYPDYPNTVYVAWTEEVLEDGIVERFPSAVSGDPAFSAYEIAFMESDGEDFPSGWTMLDMQQDAIDPYQFLNY